MSFAEININSNTSQINQAQINANNFNKKILNQHHQTLKQTDDSNIHHFAKKNNASDLSLMEKKFSFVLKKILVKGATAFPIQSLEKFYQPFYKKKITFSTLRKIVDDITNFYQAHDYLLSQAILPPQTIAHGVVTIQVIEGYIGDVKIKGNIQKKTVGFLNACAQFIRLEKPVKQESIQKLSHLLNHYPGISSQLFLRKGTIPLTSDILVLSEQPIKKITFSIDNKGTESLGYQRMIGGLDFYSLMRGGDNWNANIAKSFHHELMFFNINTTNRK